MDIQESELQESTSSLTPSDVRKMFSFSGPDGIPAGKTGHASPSPYSSAGMGMGADPCAKCGGRVYQVERVGPVNKVVFHKGCFRCYECGQNLTLKTYYTNPSDPLDSRLYCSKHCPKVTHQGMDASAVGIRAALKAPNRGLQSSVNDVVRWYGDVPKIDLEARHIREAILAQSEFDRKHLLDNRHHFPVWMGRTKKKLLRYQEELERRQREEEDQLVRAFHDERVKEAEMMDREIREEWEANLRHLATEFESKGKPKQDSTYHREVNELTKTMTKKKASKLQALTIKLQTKAQEQTADMVKKHSEQMLSLLHAKQQEMKEEIELEIKSVVGENPDVLAEALTAMEISKEIPGAHPPRIRKRDLYHDPSVFAELDERVFKVAESEQCSFTELVDLLTEHCVSDLQKARAIFRWITVKDLNVMEFSETVGQETPLGLLRGIKYGTETYHSLFMRLCSYAGLVCREVKGHSKSVGYEPGMKIESDTFLNSWNVILIASDWWPVQCNWAARHLVMNREPDNNSSTNNNNNNNNNSNSNSNNRQSSNRSSSTVDKIRYEYDEHYFLTDPDEFIQEFWAREPEWQLLERPITLEEFVSRPFVRSIFFENGLEFSDDSRKSVLEANERGGVELKLNMPSELKGELVFHYHLRFAAREKRRDLHHNGIALDRFVFHTISDQLALFSVHVPTPGDYFMEVFVNRVEEIRKFKAERGAASLLQSFRLKCACKLRIACSSIGHKMIPLPSCAAGEWGPVKAKRYFDVVCLSHQAGVVNATEEATLRFRLKKRMPVRAEMFFNGLISSDLADFISLAIDDDLILAVRVVFPRKGQFGLDIYGGVDAQGSDDEPSLTHLCKFLINCTHVSRPVEVKRSEREAATAPNPTRGQSTQDHRTASHDPVDQPPRSATTAVGQLRSPREEEEEKEEEPEPNPGPTPALTLYGIKCISHKSPEISDFDKHGAVVIEMSCPSSEYVLISRLIRSSPREDWSHQVTVKESSKRYKFLVTLPRYGRYWFAVSALSRNEPQSRQSVVYNYALNFAEGSSIKRKTSSLRGK